MPSVPRAIEYVEHGGPEWCAAMIASDGLCQLVRRNWILPRPCSQQAFHVLRVAVEDIEQNVCVCKDCFHNIVEETHVNSPDETEPVRLRAE